MKNERQTHAVIFHGAMKPRQRHIAPAPIRTRPSMLTRLLRVLGLAS